MKTIFNTTKSMAFLLIMLFSITLQAQQTETDS
ncbi:MAG: hypothetical protein ACI83H_001568, partial [Glaciecola sp.]